MGMIMTIVRLPEEVAHKILASPKSVYEATENPRYPKLDLDKSWHVLHLALAGGIGGEAGPASLLLGNGHTVGDLDLGIGPGRIFFSDAVEEFASVVANASESNLRALNGRDELQDIYGGWEGPITENELDYYAHYLGELRAFVQASLGNALLVVIS